MTIEERSEMRIKRETPDEHTWVNDNGATVDGQKTFWRVCGLSMFQIATSLLPWNELIKLLGWPWWRSRLITRAPRSDSIHHINPSNVIFYSAYPLDASCLGYTSGNAYPRCRYIRCPYPRLTTTEVHRLQAQWSNLDHGKDTLIVSWMWRVLRKTTYDGSGRFLSGKPALSIEYRYPRLNLARSLEPRYLASPCWSISNQQVRRHRSRRISDDRMAPERPSGWNWD